MFEHSVKVPRLYKIAERILRGVQENKGSLKQLVYAANHQNIKALYALVATTLKMRTVIDGLLRRSQILTKETRLSPELTRILITELLWGKKALPGDSKPITTVLAYEQILKAHLSDVEPKLNEDEDIQQDSANDNELSRYFWTSSSKVQKPRYVRVNSLVTTVNKAVDAFRDEEWNLIRFTDANDYEGFLEAARSLDVYDFMVDIHIPNLLLFHPKTQFYDHSAYRDGEIILQDKASCLPGHILNPPPGSTVLDMCAAPGMKTTQLAALLNNQGTVYAVEFDEKRLEVLEKICDQITCVKTILKDALKITDEDCPNVEYILVDPSCSGSGIVDRLELDENVTKNQQARLYKLAGFQIKLLRHALTAFPSAKRVVYSTCSINVEENEDVVRQVLETCHTFKLVPAQKFLKGTWLHFGSPDFGDIGKFCLYTRPEVDLTNGFFVAVFERLEDGEENPFLNKYAFKKIRNRNVREKSHTFDDQGGSKNEKWGRKRSDGKINEDVDQSFEDQQVGFDNGIADIGDTVNHAAPVGKSFHDQFAQESLVKKKKKKGKNHSQESSKEETEVWNQQGKVKCDSSDEAVDEKLSEGKGKKNKKRKHVDLVEQFDGSDLQEVTSMSVGEEKHEELLKEKGKKKKAKYQNADDASTQQSTIDGENEDWTGVSEEVLHKKKKKKSKHEQSTDAIGDESNHCADIGEEILPKKKKKRSKGEQAGDVINDESNHCADIDEEIIHKKKKKKHEQANEESEENNIQNSVYQETGHKKKKKKAKTMTSKDFESEDIEAKFGVESDRDHADNVKKHKGTSQGSGKHKKNKV